MSSNTNEKSILPEKAAVVTPIKPSKPSNGGPKPAAAAVHVEQKENAPDGVNTITGDSYLHFSRHSALNNREIVLQHYDFVRWAKKLENPQGNMKLFTDWLTSDEATALQLQGQGNETFTFGQHKGNTFKEVARMDPEYHTRYVRVLKKNGKEPFGALIHYIEYVEALELERRGSERFTFGQHSGQRFCEIAKDDPGYHARYIRALRHKGEEPDGVLARYIAYFNDWKRAQDNDIESRKRNTSNEPKQPSAKKPRES